MNPFKKWTAAALALALAASISPVLAVPTTDPLADFRIDASDMDVPDRTISIERYYRDESGSFLPESDATGYGNTINCKVNRVTGDATFYIHPKSDGVQVTVDYLTDVNGDGLYELLDGGDSPVWDALDPLNGLVRGGSSSLVSGRVYILYARTLSQQFEWAVQDRTQDWSLEASRQTSPLCRVTLRRTDAAEEYEQFYYLEIHGQLLTPPDVSQDQWYYAAVEYSLIQGWFTGLEDGRFGPDEPLTRAQLAQVLWAAENHPSVEKADGPQASDFSDVYPTDWFYPAVSWCRQEGLMAGYEDGSFLPNAPLTREQLAAVLQRYEDHAGYAVSYSTSLAQYSDEESVSPWAYDSVCWAVFHRMLPIFDNSLRPRDTVTRAELAFALYSFHTGIQRR